MYGEAACKGVSLAGGYYQGSQTQYLKAVAPGAFGWKEDECSGTEYCIYGRKIQYEASKTGYKTATNLFYWIQCPYGKGCYSQSDVIVCGINGHRHSKSGNDECFNCDKNRGCMYRNQYFPYPDPKLPTDPAEPHIYELTCPIGTYSDTYDLTCHDDTHRRNYCPHGYRTTNLRGTAFSGTIEQECTIHGLYGNDPLPDKKQGCVTGTYTTTGIPYCLVSPPGFISARNNTALFEDDDQCLEGYYCSLDFEHTTSTYGLKTARCPHGNYARDSKGSHTMEVNCDACPPGHRCPGNSLKEKCKAGYICDLGVIKESVTCPSGFYYDESLVQTTPLGTYELCFQCVEGKVCANDEGPALSSTVEDCPKGYRCGLQTSNPKAYPSDPGYYIDITGAILEPSKKCRTNTYCPSGAEEPIVCPVIFYNSL